LTVGNNIWAGGNPSIFIYDSKARNIINTLQRHTSAVKGMQVVTGTRVWSFSICGQVCIWN